MTQAAQTADTEAPERSAPMTLEQYLTAERARKAAYMRGYRARVKARAS